MFMSNHEIFRDSNNRNLVLSWSFLPWSFIAFWITGSVILVFLSHEILLLAQEGEDRLVRSILLPFFGGFIAIFNVMGMGDTEEVIGKEKIINFDFYDFVSELSITIPVTVMVFFWIDQSLQLFQFLHWNVTPTGIGTFLIKTFFSAVIFYKRYDSMLNSDQATKQMAARILMAIWIFENLYYCKHYWVITLVIVGLSIYLLPSIIARIRNHQSKLAIFFLNVFAGWTALGWIVSLVWSGTSVKKVE
jgi:hypothetical protein